MTKLNKKTKYRGLSLLLAAGLIASSASVAVVSCKTGISLEKILQRRRDTKNLNLTYSSQAKSWNPAHTQNAADGEFLANLYAGALGIDEYGRTYGDVFTSGYASAEKGGSYVGNPDPKKDKGALNEGGEEAFNPSLWTYKIRNNANWYNAKGEILRKILPSDFVNTAKYILNLNNASQLANLWKTFIKNADVVSELLTNYIKYPDKNGLKTPEGNALTGKELVNAAWDKAITAVESKKDVEYTIVKDSKDNSVTIKAEDIQEGGFGLKIDEDAGKVIFHTSKPTSYFETVLTYGSFSPIYDFNVDKLSSGPIDAFSGAYLPQKVVGDDKVLVKNDKYHFAEKTSIEKISWSYIASPSTSSGKERFEAGETDSFGINQADISGWDKYIGADALNPKFTGVYSTDPNEDFSFGIYYNFANSSESTNDEYASSKILQLEDTRQLLATGFNRTDFVKYYSSKFDDKDAKVSKNLRNVYTSPKFAINPAADLGEGETGSKDYVAYVKEAVEDLTKNHNGGLKAADLDEGNDPLLNNSEKLNGKTRDTLIKNINDFIIKNSLKTTNEKVELIWLLSPDNKVTNPYLTSMIDNFNAIDKNPLKIVTIVTNTDDEWLAKQEAGEFDLLSSGWGPDYADPFTYLATYKIDGDYSAYSGTRRFTDTVIDSSTGKYDEETASKSKYYTSISKDFYETLKNYDDTITSIDLGKTIAGSSAKAEQTTEQRYKDFAKAEAKVIYSDFLFTPFFNRNQYKAYKVSYVKPYTYGNAIFGLSKTRLFTQQKSSSIATKEEYDYQINQYKLVREAINARPSTGKANNVLYK